MLADRIVLLCTLVLAAAYWRATEQIPILEIGDPLGPRAFPRLLIAGLLLTACGLAFETWRARARPPVPADETAPGRSRRGTLRMLVGVVAWTALYFAAFEPLGYLLATSAFLLGLMAYFHRGRWVANILTAALFTVGSYLLFAKLLSVNLAKGVLAF